MVVRKPLIFNSRLEQLQFGDSIDIESLTYAGKKHHRGVTPYPFTPINKGDTWEELDINDNFLNAWIFDGTNWLSQKTYEFPFTSPNLAQNSTLNTPFFPVDNRANLLLLDFILAGQQNGTSTGTSHWVFDITRIATGSVTTSIVAFNTFNPTVFGTAFRTAIFPINTFINVSATSCAAIRVAESRLGNVTKSFSHKVTYKLSRL